MAVIKCMFRFLLVVTQVSGFYISNNQSVMQVNLGISV